MKAIYTADDITGAEPLSFLRKLRDRYLEELLSWLDDSETHVQWLDKMVTWTDYGASAFAALHLAMLDRNMESLIGDLMIFRAICSAIHEKEKATLAAGLALADL